MNQDPRWQQSLRYPDPSIVALDASFKKYHLALSAVERLYHGTRWGEGPVWLGDARCLLWSDIPNNRVLKWDEETGAVSAWRKPANNANGHTRDRQGRVIACEHFGRRVVRFEYDGAITVLADSYKGKRLNSPNDVVVKSDGSIWFTDPP
ncbi:MAG: SMP-30/gluconolactonase/LRE family protein, partial [Alphaproteobacteria bacterium]